MADIALDVAGFEAVRLQEGHLGEVLDLMNGEGWYYYDHRELARYLALGQDCFVLLRRGRVVGSVFTTNYGNQAWIGNVVVAAPDRGKGLATRLIRSVMDLLREEKGVFTFRLGSVPLAIGLYKRLGFHAETFMTAQEAPLPLGEDFEPVSLAEGVTVGLLGPEHLDAVAALDAEYFKSDRRQLLGALYGDSIKAASLCLKHGDRLVGFLMVRRRQASRTEGGFAEGPDHAYRLGPCCVLPEYGIDGFRALFQAVIPAINGEVRSLGGSARMYAVFPRNADREAIHADTLKLAREMGMAGNVDLARVFDEHEAIFGARPSAKNAAQWDYMAGLGFSQEYFEQVMCCVSGEETSPQAGAADPEGVFSSATPGDMA